MRIAIVAGEASGDLLAAALIRAIRARVPDAVFEGVAGPRMQAEGCAALYPSEDLAVMGLVEVLRHLPRLLRIRSALAKHFTAHPPDVFIGVDAPDFNIGLECRLKQAGIRTVHFVSPTVWAWRQRRVHRIARCVDRLLTLFPFEADFYRAHAVPVKFVGHPLADEIPEETDRDAARRALGLSGEGRTVALLPGSRRGEVQRLAPVFLATAAWLQQRCPEVCFVAPLATPATRAQFEALLRAQAPQLPITVLEGDARLAMTAADAVLVASGTATLETLLLKRPMVVAYRLAPLTYWLAKRLVRVRRFALPNLLAGRDLVPEFIQHDATPERLGAALLELLEQPERGKQMVAAFTQIHHALRRDAAASAAEAVVNLVR